MPRAVIYLSFHTSFLTHSASGNCSTACFVPLKGTLLKDDYECPQLRDDIFSVICPLVILSCSCMLNVG